MDLERTCDWAVDVFPSDINDTFTFICQLIESVWEQVEVIRTTARALIDDLE